jgi:hypothetical protein
MFAIDVLLCSRCAGRRLVSVYTGGQRLCGPLTAETPLAHVALPSAAWTTRFGLSVRESAARPAA